MSAFRNINWYSLGSNIISGIVSGIGGAGGSLFSSLRSLASSALASAKSALRIGSPSKVFRDEVGKWIPAGLAEGVDDNSYLVDDAINSLVQPPEFELAEYDYNVSDTGHLGEKTSSGDEAWLVESPELIDRVDRLVQLLEYYLPRKTRLSGIELTNYVSRGINKQVRELEGVW